MAGSFSISLAQFAIKSEKQAVVACQKIAMEAFKRVIEKSPVGDPSKWDAGFVAAGTKLGWFDKNYVGGRFRANWGVSIGSPFQGTNEDHDKTPVGNRGGKTIADAEWKGAAWNGRGSIYLNNNVPYSVVLERGHSKQAPSGMVRLTVAEMQNGAAEAAIK